MRGASRPHPRYAALASHYLFEPRFCMPAHGNQKPDAECAVKAVQRRFATPVPRAADLEELNTFLRDLCMAKRARTVQSLFGPFEIAARFAEDRAAAVPLPAYRFDPCVIHPAVVVDKYQTVAYDTNRYSVPLPFAFQMVTLKGSVDRVVIVAHSQPIARHERSQARHTMPGGMSTSSWACPGGPRVCEHAHEDVGMPPGTILHPSPNMSQRRNTIVP